MKDDTSTSRQPDPESTENKDLADNEHQYKLFFENTQELIYVVQDFRLVFVNNALRKFTGMSEGELIGKNINDMAANSELKRLAEHHISVATGKITTDTSEFKSNINGIEKDLLVNSVTYTWKGKPATLNFATDITSRKKAETELKERETILNTVLQSVAEGIVVTTVNKEIMTYNKKFVELWGFPQELLAPDKNSEMIEFMFSQLISSEDHREKIRKLYDNDEDNWESISFKDGKVFERFSRSLNIRNKKARLWSYRDITEKIRTEKTLKQNEEDYRTLIANIPGAVYRCLHDKDWTMLYISPDIMDISGRSAYDFKGEQGVAFSDICHPDDLEMINSTIDKSIADKKSYDCVYRIYHIDGSIRWVHEKGLASLNADGKVKWLDGIMIDITKRKLQEEMLEKKTYELERKQQEVEQLNAQLKIEATTDALTGVSNRRVINDIINYEINRSARENTTFSIMLLDTDFFKKINDTHGHMFGDELLKFEVSLLKQTLRKQDTIFRWGGDEFLILLPETNLEMTEKVAEKIIKAVRSSELKRGEDSVNFTLSLGITQYKPGEKIDECFKRADNAPYESKNKGRNRITAIG